MLCTGELDGRFEMLEFNHSPERFKFMIDNVRASGMETEPTPSRGLRGAARGRKIDVKLTFARLARLMDSWSS